ncbi:unnamed protein product, partial [Rotaria sp. Silwood2]
RSQSNIWASYESLNDSRSLSSSLSTSSTGTKKQRMKPRPCLIWNTNPIQVLLMARFDRSDVTNPNFQCGSLSTGYIRRHLLSVYPKEGLDSRRAIKAKTTKNSPITITNTNLILIPVTVVDLTTFDRLVPEFFDQEDMNYVNSLLFELSIEETQQKLKEKSEAISKINYELILNNNNDDNNDNASLPTTRSFFSNQYMSSLLSPLKKINIIENKNFTREISLIENIDDHDDERIIFLLNETGESLSIENLIGLKIPMSSTPVNIIQYEYVLLIVLKEYQLDADHQTIQIEDSQKKQKIDFKIRNHVKTMNMNGICKRVFDLGLSSYSNWPMQILCDTQIHNDHRCITFSSIVKINNNTTRPLIILNIDSIDAKQYHTIAKIDVDDEYYVPIASLYRNSGPTIFIGIDGEAYLENTNQLDRNSFTFSIHSSFHSTTSLSDVQCSMDILEPVHSALMNARFLVDTFSSNPLIRSDRACEDLVDEVKIIYY